MKLLLTRSLLLVTTLAALGALPLRAQILSKPTVSLELAKRIAAEAHAEAAKSKLTVVIAIIDDGGSLVYLERMDGTQLGSIVVAQEKATTALKFKRSSKVFEDMVAGGRNAVLSSPESSPSRAAFPWWLTVPSLVRSASAVPNQRKMASLRRPASPRWPSRDDGLRRRAARHRHQARSARLKGIPPAPVREPVRRHRKKFSGAQGVDLDSLSETSRQSNGVRPSGPWVVGPILQGDSPIVR